MKESKNLIKYKWDHGVYGLKEMTQVVLNELINQNQFFEITRYNFQTIRKNIQDKN